MIASTGKPLDTRLHSEQMNERGVKYTLHKRFLTDAPTTHSIPRMYVRTPAKGFANTTFDKSKKNSTFFGISQKKN